MDISFQLNELLNAEGESLVLEAIPKGELKGIPITIVQVIAKQDLGQN